MQNRPERHRKLWVPSSPQRKASLGTSEWPCFSTPIHTYTFQALCWTVWDYVRSRKALPWISASLVIWDIWSPPPRGCQLTTHFLLYWRLASSSFTSLLSVRILQNLKAKWDSLLQPSVIPMIQPFVTAKSCTDKLCLKCKVETRSVSWHAGVCVWVWN